VPQLTHRRTSTGSAPAGSTGITDRQGTRRPLQAGQLSAPAELASDGEA